MNIFWKGFILTIIVAIISHMLGGSSVAGVLATVLVATIAVSFSLGIKRFNIETLNYGFVAGSAAATVSTIGILNF